jgi:hypothetical protein
VLAFHEHGVADAAERASAARWPERRMLVAGPLVAMISTLAALLATASAGVPFRDPDHVAGRRLLMVVALVLLLVVLDVVVRAVNRSAKLLPPLRAIELVRRERWTWRRGVAVASALVSFYVTYLAYRNLKSVVPLLRPDELFDRQLAEFDRAMFAGNDPAALLHSLLGTGLPAHVLSASYMLFFAFIPGTLAFALVFARDLKAGLFYVTAQSLNWLLGAATYFLLPSLGPIYADPAAFGNLPPTGVSELQRVLFEQRVDFLHDPVAGTAQSIAAFSSLHVSIFLTAALIAHMLGLGRRLRSAAWISVGLTVAATIYLGWHYVADDLGGVAVALMAIWLARVLTGFDLRTARAVPAPNPAPA